MDEQTSPMRVSGIGQVIITRGPGSDADVCTEVWREGIDADGPYLTFGRMPAEVVQMHHFPRAAWTVVSGDGVMVMRAELLEAKPLDPRLAALDETLRQMDEEEE